MQVATTTPLFSASLKPDRSSRVAGGWITLVIAAIFVVPFAMFVDDMLLPCLIALGAGCAGLTLLTLRQAGEQHAMQRVMLWADQLEIITINAQGTRSLQRFNPQTVRVVLDRDIEERALAMRLRDGRAEMELGEFLSAEDRASFAQAFGTALRQARAAR